MKTPCYTTKTGLRIGCAYQPPVRQMTYDEIQMQSVLLGAKPRRMSVGKVALICLLLWLGMIWATR